MDSDDSYPRRTSDHNDTNKLSFKKIIFLLVGTLLLPSVVFSATGEVQFSIASQYQIGTAGSYFNNGNTIAKVFDGDLTTWWDANQSYANGSNVGLDLTVNAKVTRMRVAPRTGYTVRLFGAVLQGATVSSSTGPWTTIYTIPSFPPFYPQRQLNEISIDTSGQYYRYYRLVMPNGAYGSLAEMRLIGVASSTTPYLPVPPAISPMGGKFHQPIQVSLSSLTTDATIYYTTDGTTPTYSGGSPQGTTQLYSGPFMITNTATTTVKAIAVSASTYVSEVSDTAYFSINPVFNPGWNWYDTSGHLIESHDGGISYFNGKYYWYGETLNNSSPEIETLGATVYSSNDLLNWKYEGMALYVNNAYKLERPHVIYNATSSTYVMWAHNVTNARAVIATSSSPLGPFTASTTSQNPDGMGMNDMTLYKDTDGTAYLVYTSSDNTKMVISRLTSDYATTSNTYITSSANANRSAPAVFKRGSIYFLLNSGQNSWTATANKYSTSTSMLGTWSTLTNPFQSSAEEDYTLAYHSQTSDVLTVQGRTDGYVYIGDRFDGSATASGSLYNSRHVWLPITFPYAGMMSVSWASSWSLDSVFTSATLPTSVSNLTATKNGLSVNLSWTNNETNSYSLYLDRATDSAFTQNFISIFASTTLSSYTDSNIVNDTKYYYRIRVITAAGVSTSSTVIGDFLLSSDTTAPQGEITVPSNGATVVGRTVTLTASSSDNIQVSSVQFQVDSVNVGSSGATSPYSITWDSTSVSDGDHTIHVIVTDSSGNIATSSDVTVHVANQTVTVTPDVSTIVQNTTGNTIVLTGNATTWTAGTPGSPTFSISGGTGTTITSQTVSNSTSATLTISAGSAVGTFKIIAPDSNASTTITVSADSIAPSVSITTPSNGATLSGSTVTLTASSSDNAAVTSVQFKLDNVSIGASGATSPYSITWNSTSVADGAHTLVAVVADGAGNISTSSAISVTVNNSVVASVSTSNASSVDMFSAVFNGVISNDGGASSTVKGFQYGLTSSLGTTISESVLAGVGNYSTTTTGLSCATTYYYRFYSTNLSGTSYGTTKSFTTLTCPAASVSGEIQFSTASAYQFGTSGSYNNSGNVISKVFDNDVTTWWDSQTANGAYAGLDLRVPQIVTRMRIAPRTGYTVRVYGAILQGATVSSTTGPWTNIYTIPSYPPYYAQRQMNEIAVDTGGSSYRYYRIVMPDGTNGSLAEFKLIGNAGTTTPFIPVTPTISPNGGQYSLPMRIRLSSLTTDASIYYTTDNTVPAVSNGVPQGTTQLYSAPFTLSASSTVRAIAVSTLGQNTFTSEVSEPSYFYFDTDFKPGQNWYDEDGHLIESHDGEVAYFNGKYYWYGQIFNGNDPENEAVGVSAYSSSDLIHWKDEGPIIYMGRSYMLERPHVIYNDSTHKYVLWGHHVISSGHSTAVVAYNDSPTGAFTVATSSYNPDGLYLNDMNLYKDVDGQAYLLYSIGTNTQFVISRLTSDYLQTSGTYITPAVLAGREAPAMILRNGVYFLLTSGLSGWAPNENKYSTSTSVMGTWSSLTDPFQTSVLEDRLTAYRSQTTDIQHVPGRGDAYIYIGDRFDYSNTLAGSLYYSRHIWLPMTFPTNNTMSITWEPTWNLDTVFPTVYPPTAPSNFTVTRNGTSADLSWTNNATTSHMIYVDRATNQNFTSNVVSDLRPEGATTFTDSHLSLGTDYYYRIRIVNADGKNYSSTVSTIVVDSTAPTLSSASPSGTLSINTTSTSLSVQTSENATCKYSTISNITYLSMTAFDNTGATTHTTNVSGLSNGSTYNYYVKCADSSNNISDQATITFSVASEAVSTPTPTSAYDQTVHTSYGSFNSYYYNKYVVPNLPQNIKSKSTSNNQKTSNVSSFTSFKTEIKMGSITEDVRELQRFLNKNGFPVAKTGPGSPGKETNVFSTGTQAALMKFQEKYKKQILVPAGLNKPNGVLGPNTRKLINSMNGKNN